MGDARKEGGGADAGEPAPPPRLRRGRGSVTTRQVQVPRPFKGKGHVLGKRRLPRPAQGCKGLLKPHRLLRGQTFSENAPPLTARGEGSRRRRDQAAANPRPAGATRRPLGCRSQGERTRPAAANRKMRDRLLRPQRPHCARPARSRGRKGAIFRGKLGAPTPRRGPLHP